MCGSHKSMRFAGGRRLGNSSSGGGCMGAAHINARCLRRQRGALPTRRRAVASRRVRPLQGSRRAPSRRGAPTPLPSNPRHALRGRAAWGWQDGQVRPCCDSVVRAGGPWKRRGDMRRRTAAGSRRPSIPDTCSPDPAQPTAPGGGPVSGAEAATWLPPRSHVVLHGGHRAVWAAPAAVHSCRWGEGGTLSMP